MAYKIPGDCSGCDHCRPQCPRGAITEENGKFWINSALCNNCEGYHDEPQCVVHCPIEAPVPAVPRKGRMKAIETRPLPSPNLFANGRNTPFASAIVIWEACNLLAQSHGLPWQKDSDSLTYQRPVNQGRGLMTLKMTDETGGLSRLAPVNPDSTIDLRAACLHLIYAAYATALEQPWEQEFVINDQQIEAYLGLDKRKDLNKPARITLIKELALQPCLLQVAIDWPTQGKIRGFSVQSSPLWHLVDLQHHFQEDELGCKHLVGLTLRLRAGEWAKYFLNRQGCKDRAAFYQYSTLPHSLLHTVMSLWQQHEGALRIMLWLLFKIRMGKEQRVTVPTLMRIAYGEERILQATTQREDRKRLLRTFESDLAVLYHYGLKPGFDPITYPPEIQPLWAKLSDIPDDAEAALEFWMNDGSRDNRLTDAGPRGKWNLLMNARILWFELPSDWEQAIADQGRKKQRSSTSLRSTATKRRTLSPLLSGDQIADARKRQGWSQRYLAERTGKSQSWIRDVESGRFQVKAADQVLLRKVLGLG